MKVLKTHATEIVALKTAPIDSKIIPVIKWLNSYRDVVTYWCCEGGWQKPYVIFTCLNQLVLARILDRLGGYGECTVQWYESTIRYTIRFRDDEHLARFIDERFTNLHIVKNEAA